MDEESTEGINQVRLEAGWGWDEGMHRVILSVMYKVSDMDKKKTYYIIISATMQPTY